MLEQPITMFFCGRATNQLSASRQLAAAHSVHAGDGAVFGTLAPPPTNQVPLQARRGRSNGCSWSSITDHEFNLCSLALVDEEFRSINRNKSLKFPSKTLKTN